MKKLNSVLCFLFVLCLTLWVAVAQDVRTCYAVPAGFQGFYVPLPAVQSQQIFYNINSRSLGNTMHYVVGVTASADNTTVYYDHWENGYDNGANGDEVVNLNKGEVHSFESSNIPTNPRGTNLYYDGGDRIYVAGSLLQLVVSIWPESPGTVFTDAWEVYPVQAWEEEFTIPVGENLAGTPKNYGDFAKVWALVMAGVDGTEVTIDDPEGAGLATTLNQGKTAIYEVKGAGTTVSASEPVEVQLMTGTSASWEMRGYTMTPTTYWSDTYYSPVPSWSSGNTDLFIYNPNTSEITVNYQDLTGVGTFTVLAGDTVSYWKKTGRYVPKDSGVYLNATEVFWGIIAADTDSATWDWGSALIPADFLGNDNYLSWAPGTSNLSKNGSPVYITALNNDTTVFIDYGPNDGVFDKTITLNKLNVTQIYDPDNDNTGMHIVSTSPVAVAWGESPDKALSGTPYLDMGYTSLPLPEEWIDVALKVEKTAAPTVVQENDTVTFTIVVSVPADSTGSATGVDLEDILPSGWDYVTGTANPFEPDQSGSLLTWAGDWTIEPGNSVIVTFQGRPTASADKTNPNRNVASATGEAQGATLTADDDAFVTIVTTPPALKNAVDQNGGNLEPGDEILYTITIENPNYFDLNDVRYEDVIPANTTYNADSVSLPPGSTLTATSPTLIITGINVPARGQTLISFLVTVDDTLPAGVTAISNQGTFFYNDGAQDRSEQTDGDTTVSGAQPTILPVTAGLNLNETTKSVSLYKDTDGNGVASPGDTLRYTVVIPNTGNKNAMSVTFNDPVPANTTYVAGSVNATGGTAQYVGNSITWSGDIAAGTNVTIAFDVTISTGIVVGTVISNQGTVNVTVLTDGDTNEPGDQPTDVTVGGSPEGIAIKSVTDVNGGNLEPGDELLYTITMLNQSGLNVENIELSDTMPANTTYKTDSITSPAGSTVVSTTPTLRITDINVPSHTEVIISFIVTVNSPLPAGVTQIDNQGTVFYDSDGDGINDSFQQTDGDTATPGENPTTIPVTAGPNFDETTKSVALQRDAEGDGFVSPGDTLRYTVLIPNTGNQDSAGAVLYLDPMPAHTTYVAGSANANNGTVQYFLGDNRLQWSGPIAAGSSVTIMFDVTVNAGISTGITISNQGTVNGDVLTDGDTSQPGDQPTDVNVGGSPAGLAVKSVTDVNGGNLEPGDELLYTITMLNQSGFIVEDIEFADAMPANTTYKAGSVTAPAGSTVESESPTLRITGIDVPAHAEIILTFLVVVDNPVPAGVSQIENQGVIFYDSDGDGTNDSFKQTDGDTAQPGENPTTLPLTAGPNFSETTKGVIIQNDADLNGVVSPGDTLRYTVIIPNTGNQDSSGDVSFLDLLPANTTYVAGSADADSGTVNYVAGNNSIQWSGPIAAGSSVTITFDVMVNAGISTGITISNQGTVNGDVLTDGDTGAPGDQPTDVNVGGSPEGVAVKSVIDVNGGNLEPGDELLYTITMLNQSGFDVEDIEFADAMPANTTYKAGSVTAPAGSTVETESPTLWITGIDVPSNGQVIITFNVTINDPLPSGFTTIINTGTVYYDSNGDGQNDTVQPTDGDPDTPGNQPTPTNTGSISGTVFDDPNGDGIQDESSTPLPDVTVELQDENGTVIATTTTDENGFYQFVVPPGDYIVVEIDPSGYQSITPNQVSISVPSASVTDVDFADEKVVPPRPRIPTLSEWGLGLFTVLTAFAGLWLLRRRRENI